MSTLFSPFRLKDVTLRNRIAVSPMCQYSGVQGMVTGWHLPHYAGLARGGAGLVVVEATAVSPEGRITQGCLGIWNDEQAERLVGIARSIKAAGAVPGIQIAHAGRKASANRPWEGDDHLSRDDPRAWQPIAPSALAHGNKLSRVPRAMSLDDITRVKNDFAAAARRAYQSGFEWIQLHFAHGYLAQTFYSSHSNLREDRYGGTYSNRIRFPLETFNAVREVWPERLPLTMRLGVIEYDGRDTETLIESIDLIKRLRGAGLDLLDVSIGFTTDKARIPWGPALLAPIAGRVRREANLPVASSWNIDTSSRAENALANGELDVVMVGRAHLANPHWAYAVARSRRIPTPTSLLPAQYAHWLERYGSGAD